MPRSSCRWTPATRTCRAQRRLFTFIAEADRRSLWERDGAHDMAHWLRMRYGISDWKARRWIASAHALRALPLTSEAFSTGRLGVDKVVELTRFATPERAGSSCMGRAGGAGHHQGEGQRARKQSVQQAPDLEADRSFDWWCDPEDRQLQFEGRLPVAEGRVVVRAVERMMRKLPQVPAEESPSPGQRRADALVGICSARVASDPDPDRATVVVHVPVEVLWSEEFGSPTSVPGGSTRAPGMVRARMRPRTPSRDVPWRAEGSSPSRQHGASRVTHGSRPYWWVRTAGSWAWDGARGIPHPRWCGPSRDGTGAAGSRDAGRAPSPIPTT